MLEFEWFLNLKALANKKALSDEKAYTNPVRHIHCWGYLSYRILMEKLLLSLQL